MRGKRTRNYGVPVACATTTQSLPPQDDADLAASQRSHFVLKFVGRERGDCSILIARELIRECTGFKTKADGSIRIVDPVRAEVCDRTGQQILGFLRGRGRWSIGRDFRKVGTRKHEKETALRVENNDALRIGAIRLDLLPFGSTCSQEASVQVPTSWSLSDHCWLMALLGNAASPSIVIAEILRTLPRFMFPSLLC